MTWFYFEFEESRLARREVVIHISKTSKANPTPSITVSIKNVQVCPNVQHLQSRLSLQLHDVIFNISCDVNGLLDFFLPLFLVRFNQASIVQE